MNKIIFKVRTFHSNDIEKIIQLDHLKWEEGAANEDLIQSRLTHCLETSWGCFDAKGDLHASIFLMRKERSNILTGKDWFDITDNGKAISNDPSANHLFSISFTSRSPEATLFIRKKLEAYCLRKKIISVLTGSPVPGYEKWIKKNENGKLEEYLLKHQYRKLDHQLNLYKKYGFTKILAGKDNYFPHQKSMNYGVIIEKVTPWMKTLPLKLIPEEILMKLIVL